MSDYPLWTRALSALSWSHSFWATLMYEMLTTVFTKSLPTLAVGGGKLYVNYDYFSHVKFNDGNRIFMVAHEVSHEMYFHPDLMKQYMESGVDGEPFDMKRFNVAADYVINAGLVRFRIGEYHPDWLLSDQFKWDDNVLDVYRRLRPKNPPPQAGEGEQGEGEGGQANGQGSPADGQAGNEPESETPSQPQQYDILDEDGNVVDETPADAAPQDDHLFDEESPHGAEDWKQAVAGAQQQAKSMGHGSEAFDRMIEDYLAPEKDWREELREYITARRGRETLNRRRVHKRKMYERGIPAPLKHSYQMDDLLLIHDVSGSVSTDEHMLCKATNIDILTQCRPKSIRVLCVASSVTDDVTFATVEEYMDWQPKGTGGTDMEAGFRYVEEDGFTPQLAIVLTDGWTGFTSAPSFPVVWLSTDKEVEHYEYGKAIKIEPL